MYQIAVGGDQDIELFFGAGGELAIAQPGPAQLVRRMHVMPRKEIAKRGGHRMIEKDPQPPVA